MKSYQQLCALALALDVVGDRWTLLIIRELLVRDTARYTDLRDGLPGIATNLLADRIRSLEDSGVVERVPPTPPVSTPQFRLSAWGRQLRPVVEALAIWGGPQVAAASGTEEFRSRWLIIPATALLHDARPEAGPATVEVRTGDEPITIEVDGEVRARTGADGEPDLIITGPPRSVLGVLAGALDDQRAAAAGVSCRGDLGLLGRIIPARARPASLSRPR